MVDGAALMDRPPAIHVNGTNGALEGPQYKASLGEKLGADMNRGAERRRATGENISRFFSSMKQKLNRGVDVVFATPNIAGTLGGEVKSFATETASLSKDALVAAGRNVAEAGLNVNNKIVDARDRMVLKAQDAGDVVRGRIIDAKDRVVEAGHRANDSVVDTRDRWVLRAQNAGDVVRARVKETGYAAGRKTVELGKKAARFGLEISVVPVAKSVDALSQIPADITQWRADNQTSLAQDLNASAIARFTRGEARAAALKTESERVQRMAEDRFSSMGKAQEAANKKAQELRDSATAKRSRVGILARVRDFADRLSTAPQARTI